MSLPLSLCLNFDNYGPELEQVYVVGSKRRTCGKVRVKAKFCLGWVIIVVVVFATPYINQTCLQLLLMEWNMYCIGICLIILSTI